MGKMTIAVPILLLTLLASSLAYAVNISLNSDSVMRIGGTGQVDVLCPASSCQIDGVTWTMTSSAPYLVDKVNVDWTPAENGDYDVYVTLYDSGGTIIASGSTSASGLTGGTSTTTIVDLTTDVNPANVYKIEIIIVQTG